MKKKEISEEEAARAKRVLSLRNLSGLSRRAFAERYGVSPGTLQHWEGASPGVSLPGAKRLVKSLGSGGIHCTIEWLLHGIGNPPALPLSLSAISSECIPSTAETNRESELITQELALFQQHYPNAIEMVVADDGMFPAYHPGEIIAGLRYHQRDIEQVIGLDCIVFTKSSELLLRQVRKSNIQDYYNLVCINPQTTVEKPVLYEVELVSAAPVLWVRRKRL